MCTTNWLEERCLGKNEAANYEGELEKVVMEKSNTKQKYLSKYSEINIQERKIKDEDNKQEFEILKRIWENGSKVDQVEIIKIDEESVCDPTKKVKNFDDNKNKKKDNNHHRGKCSTISKKKVKVKSIKKYKQN